MTTPATAGPLTRQINGNTWDKGADPRSELLLGQMPNARIQPVATTREQGHETKSIFGTSGCEAEP